MPSGPVNTPPSANFIRRRCAHGTGSGLSTARQSLFAAMRGEWMGDQCGCKNLPDEHEYYSGQRTDQSNATGGFGEHALPVKTHKTALPMPPALPPNIANPSVCRILRRIDPFFRNTVTHLHQWFPLFSRENHIFEGSASNEKIGLSDTNSTFLECIHAGGECRSETCQMDF